MYSKYKSIWFVGYETAQVPDLIEPEFKPRKGTTKPETIAEQLAQKREEFLANAATQPYTGCLKNVSVIEYTDEHGPEPGFSSYPDKGKKKAAKGLGPVALRFAETLKQFDYSVSRTIMRVTNNPILIIGHEPKNFLKMLGIECAILKQPIRAGWWIANSDHYNITSLMLPGDANNKTVDFKTACGYLGFNLPEDYEPCVDAQYDAELCYRLVNELGLLGQGQAVAEDELEEVL